MITLKMASRFRRLRSLYWRLHSSIPGDFHLQSWGQCTKLPASNSIDMHYSVGSMNRSFSHGGYFAQRFSTALEAPPESRLEDQLMPYVKSTYEDLEGPYHRWLNRAKSSKDLQGINGVFLVVAGPFQNSSLLGCDPVALLEKIKSLQQRYPTLEVIGFQYSSSISSDAVYEHITHIVSSEYLTFPILLSTKKFSEVSDEAFFIISKGFKSPFIYYEGDADLGTIDEAIKELVRQTRDLKKESILKSDWMKQPEVTKEPHIGSFLKNLLLYYPGSISVDEKGSRFFLSDTNHHRIIILNTNGKILDCIGSSPGFEDGEFDHAKLMRPAASFYDETRDCLYLVDSEFGRSGSGNAACLANLGNLGADLETRVLETLYPTHNTKEKSNTLWSWMKDNLGMGRDENMKSEDLSSKSFLFPWHMIKSLNDKLFIFNKSFETLWIMDLASGMIEDAVKGPPQILEICGQMIEERVSPLNKIQGNLLHQHVGNSPSFNEIPCSGLMPQFATFENQIVICDTVFQRVLKHSTGSDSISTIHFSNFGILGLPYWLPYPLERVYDIGDTPSGAQIDHVEHFSLLPGRVDIQLNVEIPKDTELVEPLQEGCLWCQTRGAATDVTGSGSEAQSLEKVGSTQQWYDELDTLAFSTPEVELNTEERNTSDVNTQEDGVCIDCAIETSPGTSEVIISAALYLKLKSSPNSCSKEEKAATIADVLRTSSTDRNHCIEILLKSNGDLEDVVFLRPLHVILKFDCRDHPKAENMKDFILTDSTVEANVSLN